MTIGVALGVVVLGLAFGAAAVRARDWLWALVSISLIGLAGYRVARFGLDSGRFVATTDELLVVIGLLLLAVTIMFRTGLPKSMVDRLIYGRAHRDAAFERALEDARQPFTEAAVRDPASTAQRARWRWSIADQPPSDEWASLADRLAAADEEWAVAAASQDEPPRWEVANQALLAEWVQLRSRYLGEGLDRARRAMWLGRIGYVMSVGLILAGVLDLTNGLFSAPPSGRAAFVPDAPPARTVHLAPIGDVPHAELQELADFYAERYDLDVGILPAMLIPNEARDPDRDQLVGEGLIDGLRAVYPEAGDPAHVVIGVTGEDLYMRGRPDWRWAFGLRTDGHLAVLSTARMGPESGPFGHQLESARLRKMVTKYLGVLYFDLPESSDPRSVLYGNILGVPDLDAMGEDF